MQPIQATTPSITCPHALREVLSKDVEHTKASLPSLNHSIDTVPQSTAVVQLVCSAEEPLNREPELDKLVQSFITKDGYDRNHGPIPYIDIDTHRVTVTGLVNTEISLSIADLRALPQHHVVSALQCAGNRRHTMRTKLKEVRGIDWFDGAVMNCRWSGPLLKDVLEKAGVKVEEGNVREAHVAFSCFQTATQDDSYYGASIPLSRAMNPENATMIALEMNGKPLTPNRGAPVRIVTPGIAGARCVKWLDQISVQMCESQNYYQQQDYKILPPEVDTKEKAKRWWDKVASLEEMPVNSAIGVPKSKTTVKRNTDGTIEVNGYALPSGANGPIVRVEVSVDNGHSWEEAELINEYEGEDAKDVELKWAWVLWKARVKVDKGKKVTIYSRATDRGGNVQEKCPTWNYRGLCYNGYGEAFDLDIS